MKFLIKFEVFDTITKKDDINQLREAMGKQMEHIHSSGKLLDGGMFGDQRGGFFILNIDKAFDLYDLLGGAIFDRCNVESHPLLSFEELGKFFKENPAN